MQTEHERERRFGIDELFFSTTDPKGIIESGNRVFSRVAAYSEEEMLGKPHSLIRHPDEPRCVFKLLWDTIGGGETIAAYVKNRAQTGEPYWVMATVTPCEGGYLSVRMKPTSPIFDTVRSVYRELRELELELGGDGEIQRKEAMQASAERLGEILASIGFEDYASFMHAALVTELSSRAAAMEAAGLGSSAGRPTLAGAGTPLRAVRDACSSISAFLDALFGARLDGYDHLKLELSSKSNLIHRLAGTMRLFSLNTRIAATRLGNDGITLGAVADLMGSRSAAIGERTGSLSLEVDRASCLLRRVGFQLSVARLQCEMTLLFADELAELQSAGRRSHEAVTARREHDVARLARCLDDTLGALLGSVGELDHALGSLIGYVGTVSGHLDAMRALEVNGRIEAARAQRAEGVVAMFAEIGGQIESSRAELAEFAAAAADGRRGAGGRVVDDVRAHLDELHQFAGSLAG